MTPTRTGVTILNYGEPDDTLACLHSLERSDDLDVDIVVVDNGPEDSAHARLRESVGRRGHTIATGDNLGYAAGNNVGMRYLLDRGCEFIWILNPDTVVGPATLRVLAQHLSDVPDCGVVGPRILFPGTPARIWSDGGTVDKSRYGATSHVATGQEPGALSKPGPIDVDYVPGASVLVRRSLVEDVGFLPERYFLYFEETDWCQRAVAAGWRVMVQRDAVMTHLKRSSGTLPTPYYLYYMTRNRYLFTGECLGLDGELAWREMEESFHKPLRRKVKKLAPHWLESFDELVSRAKRDARAGIDGRNDDITHYPRPHVKAEAC